MVEKSRILFLSANPDDMSSLELIKECNKIEDTIQTTKFRDNFEFKARHEVSIDKLQRIIGDYNPDIVHFSGHGDLRSLFFEDIDGDTEEAKASSLGNMFKRLNERDESDRDGTKIRCVVLNACYSNSLADAIKPTVDCVIGMRRAIKDGVATEFAAEFYYWLCSGNNFQSSFDLALSKMDLANLGQDIPQLSPRDKINPSTIKFVPEDNRADIQQLIRAYDALRISGNISLNEFWQDKTRGGLAQLLIYFNEHNEPFSEDKKITIRKVLNGVPSKLVTLRDTIRFEGSDRRKRESIETDIMNFYEEAIRVLRTLEG